MTKLSIPSVLVIALACASNSAWAQPDRGRVQIQNDTVVADDGVRLRGGAAFLTTDTANGMPSSWWQAWRDVDNVNLVEVNLMRNSPAYTWPTWYTGAYLSLPEILSELDAFVNQASQYGFYIIIRYDSLNIPDPNDWTAFWQAVAPRYANRTHVVYTLANEYGPATNGGWGLAESYGPSDVQWQQNAFHFIRSLAPSTHILTNTFAGATAGMLSVVQQQAQGPNSIDYSNASVDFHTYAFDPNAILALKAQFSCFSTEPGGWDAQVPWLESNGISWASFGDNPNGESTSWTPTWPQDPNTSDGTGPGGTPPPPPPPPNPNLSPDGSAIYPGQGGSLTTTEGTWTFGDLTPDGVDSYTQLNGNSNGWAVELAIASGNVYAFNQAGGHWYLWQNDTWVDIGTAPPSGVPVSKPNLIQDPNFDQQTQADGAPLIPPWSGTGPATIGVDSNHGMGGSPCGYISDPGTGAWSAITQTVAVNPNANYTLSAYIQTSSPFPGGWVVAQAPDGTVLAQQSYGELDTWTPVSVSFNSGSATSVTVFFGYTGYSGQGSWIMVDTVSMVDPPGPSSASPSSGGIAGAGTTAGSSGGKAACGLTGLETVIVLGLLALRRRKS